MTYRIVIDTNLTISAFVWGGLPLQLFNQTVENRIPILISQGMIDELEMTLRKPKFESYLIARNLTVEGIVSRVMAMTEPVTSAIIPSLVVRDPKDQLILAAAIGGKASHIVSGDKDLTSLGKYQTIIILTAAEFLALLKPPANETQKNDE